LTEIVERDAVPHLSDPVAPSFEANVETPAGLRYTVVEPGQGRSATSGDEVVVSYTLWHADGRFIDDSASRRHPHTLKLGVSTDLRLLHEAAVGMRPGERRYVKAPASFAEGAREVGLFISPDQPLVIDLTLESILTRDSDVDPDA